MNATARPTFSIYLLGFLRGQQDAAAKLAAILEIELLASEDLLARAPVLLEAHLPKERARHLEGELRRAGADVELRGDAASVRPRPMELELEAPGDGPLLELEDVAKVAPRPRPAMNSSLVAPVPMAPRRHVPEHSEHPGFWPRLPLAFIVPVLGKGVAWLAVLTVLLLIVTSMGGLGLLGMVSCFGAIGTLMSLPLVALYLGLLTDYFNQAAQCGLHDDGTFPSPRYSMPEWSSAFYRGVPLLLLIITLFALSSWLEFKGAPTAVVVLAAFVPYFYWPMALLATALTGRMTAMLPLTVMGALIRSGPQYVIVVVAGFVLTAASLLSLALLAQLFGPLGAIAAAVLLFAIVPYVSAAQGYLLGSMVGADSEKWSDFH